MNCENGFYILIGTAYFIISFILWYMFIYSPFDDIKPRKEILLTIGAIFWPVAIIIAVVDSWSNYWE